MTANKYASYSPAWRGRRIAILLSDGTDELTARTSYECLVKVQAVPRFVGVQLGRVLAQGGAVLQVEVVLEAGTSDLWDGLVLPDGEAASATLIQHAHALELVQNLHRQGRPILALGAASTLLSCVEIAGTPSASAGLVVVSAGRLGVDRVGVTRRAVNTFLAGFGAFRSAVPALVNAGLDNTRR